MTKKKKAACDCLDLVGSVLLVLAFGLGFFSCGRYWFPDGGEVAAKVEVTTYGAIGGGMALNYSNYGEQLARLRGRLLKDDGSRFGEVCTAINVHGDEAKCTCSVRR